MGLVPNFTQIIGLLFGLSSVFIIVLQKKDNQQNNEKQTEIKSV